MPKRSRLRRALRAAAIVSAGAVGATLSLLYVVAVMPLVLIAGGVCRAFRRRDRRQR